MSKSDLIPVSALFVRRDSIYKTLPGVDCWDIDRDARTWTGGTPVIAHPPCRAWGRLRQFAKPETGEKSLAFWAVETVRLWGGVLEHPAHSTLWLEANLPVPDARDSWGGWTLPIQQHDWGHRAQKSTFLYIVGCAPSNLPKIPIDLSPPTHCVRPSKQGPRKPSITKSEREHTPPLLAEWLVALARKCEVNHVPNR